MWNHLFKIEIKNTSAFTIRLVNKLSLIINIYFLEKGFIQRVSDSIPNVFMEILLSFECDYYRCAHAVEGDNGQLPLLGAKFCFQI